MDEAQLARAGAALRRVPGARFALDARLALGERRRRVALDRADRDWLASLSGRRDLRINVGSSGSHIDGWINADIERDPELRTLRMDASERWPFEDGAAVAVNSEHVIEHLNPADAPKFFREAFRVLGPGGVIRTSTPDLRGISEAYLAEDPAVLDAHRAHGYTARNHADLVNNYVHMHGHLHIYDFETLALLLREAGFDEVERVEFGQSRHELLRGVDRHDVDVLSPLVVCVDAVKPGGRGGALEAAASPGESRA
jgi:predicted SAM-dependent methyltransferase